MSESHMHFIEVATTHRLGGQHGEEGKESEEGEEGEEEALSRRFGVFDFASKTSSADPRSRRLDRDAVAMRRTDRIEQRGRWRDRGLNIPRAARSHGARRERRVGEIPHLAIGRLFAEWVHASDSSPTPSRFFCRMIFVGLPERCLFCDGRWRPAQLRSRRRRRGSAPCAARSACGARPCAIRPPRSHAARTARRDAACAGCPWE